MPHCLFWCLWRERNARCFEDSERSILDIKSFFFHAFLEWSLVLPSCTSLSLPVLLDHCNLGSNFCHCSTFPVYLGWLLFDKKFLHYLSKKETISKNILRIQEEKLNMLLSVVFFSLS